MATLGSKSIGSTVRMYVGGSLTEFIVVHQGRPGSIYDSSCNGTWLLMKDIYEINNWTKNQNNNYSLSFIHDYLNNTFLNLLEPGAKNTIKQVKIPYISGENLQSGSSGVSTKVFLLSVGELGSSRLKRNPNLGWYREHLPLDGETLDYFVRPNDSNFGANSDYVDPNWVATFTGIYNGYSYTQKPWDWATRSPSLVSSSTIFTIHQIGCLQMNRIDNEYYSKHGIRPAMILPQNLNVNSGDILRFNTQPTTPSSITVPTTVYGGKTLAVSWGISTDADGNLSGYKLERKYNDTDWVPVYSGSNRTYTDNITHGKTSVQYRVLAYDTYNVTSGYTTAPVRTVINNRPPTIDGTDRDLGTFTASAPSTNYVVNDADGGSVNVKVQLDDVQIKNFMVSLSASNNLTFTTDEWQKVRDGKHTWRITATDNHGATAVRTISFTKNVTVVEFTSNVMAADAMPTKAIMNIQGAFPAGCKLLIEICNNGNDASPTWQDVTQSVQTGKKIFFANKTKTAASWGVKVYVKLERGTASGDCCITSIGGNFG